MAEPSPPSRSIRHVQRRSVEPPQSRHLERAHRRWFGVSAMLVGLFVPKIARPASTGLAALMLGAIGMHVKVKDPIKRSIPAILVFTGAAVSAVLNRR